MPSFADYMAHFHTIDVVLSVITVLIILVAREEKRLFRRKPHDGTPKT